MMASGGSAGFNHANAACNRDTSTTSLFVSRRNVPVAPEVSSNADTVVQPSSANNPMPAVIGPLFRAHVRFL